jgi:protocatechuate 3,4-dioxygenase beta subunit
MNRKIDRRQALAAFGTAGLGAVLAGCGSDEQTAATPTPSGDTFDDAATCTVSPELTEGPYYFDVDSLRSDIAEDREGVALRLAIRVRDAATCDPIEDAVVDIWHCDAVGTYSGFESASQGGPPGGAGRTDDETYLRGAQLTNAEGVAVFRTIYPGWYRGRTVHIHAKVHLDKQTALTTQLFTNREFDERVYAREPYASDPGRDTFNDSDGIFEDGLELTLTEEGDGVLGRLTLDVQRA